MNPSEFQLLMFEKWKTESSVVVLADPHGDTAAQIAKLIPKSRASDFVWIDPDASHVPPFNPLYFKNEEELELGKESLFTTFKSLAGSAWGDESARVIINAIDAVCDLLQRAGE
jgi:hypothetical protein